MTQMMKEKYITPYVETVLTSAETVICTSVDTDPYNNNGDYIW